MSLHADVAVPARDRQGLERLCRYVDRPPLALGRLEPLTDGRLAYRFKTPWRDGTTHFVLERRELLERLRAADPTAACASGAVPRGARAVAERAGRGGAGGGLERCPGRAGRVG
ncbi:MAG: transposase [Deltaproteobacteria bacterium]|nr:transposase [Deltaproteobacteria bacterium]